MKKEKLERITFFRPAYDKRNPGNPSKDYGIGHVVCFMLLRGKAGAVHFSFSTGMLLPETVREYIKTNRAEYKFISENREYYLNKPMGYDTGYHSPKPMFEGQTLVWPTKMKKKNPNLPLPGKNATAEENSAFINNVKFIKIGKKPPKCEWLGVPCYCDGSCMRAEDYMDILIRKGSEAIWKVLEKDYKDYFSKKNGAKNR